LTRTRDDRATFENPAQFSEGILHVLVNGKFVVRDGKLVEDVGLYGDQAFTLNLGSIAAVAKAAADRNVPGRQPAAARETRPDTFGWCSDRRRRLTVCGTIPSTVRN
jgi:hypothetical protein